MLGTVRGPRIFRIESVVLLPRWLLVGRGRYEICADHIFYIFFVGQVSCISCIFLAFLTSAFLLRFSRFCCVLAAYFAYLLRSLHILRICCVPCIFCVFAAYLRFPCIIALMCVLGVFLHFMRLCVLLSAAVLSSELGTHREITRINKKNKCTLKKRTCSVTWTPRGGQAKRVGLLCGVARHPVRIA